ncbi:hypothetical protein MCHI_003581 [Candidatus Magnetoovum chiemensis]|nr:hypothetical protein MCHI_003581 [Candidatus Magnetoovum chiemensis]
MFTVIPTNSHSDAGEWKELDRGLYVIDFLIDKAQGNNNDPAKITVLKINPANYKFTLLSAAQLNEQPMSAKQWAQKYGLVAAFNAGMYLTDGLTSVGYMKNYGYVNNARIVKKYNSVFAFNRKSDDMPQVQIIDLVCQDFDRLKDKYETLIQNIRMISCDRQNVWKDQRDISSILALAMDNEGNVLVIFAEAYYNAHDLIDELLVLPLSIEKAMYLEGGREAMLYV